MNVHEMEEDIDMLIEMEDFDELPMDFFEDPEPVQEKTTLKKICETASQGCIRDPNDIQDITDRFLNTRISEWCEEKNLNKIFGLLLSLHALPEYAVKELTFLQAIYLIRQLRYRRSFCIPEEWKDFNVFELKKIILVSTKSLLLIAEGKHMLVRLFLGQNYEALLSYLESVRGKEGDDEDDEEPFEETLGELLRECDKGMKQPWKCWGSLDEYRDEILRNYDNIGILVVDNFYSAFCTNMNFYDIRRQLERKVPQVGNESENEGKE